MNEQQSDFQWLQQFARAGDQGAFHELVHRHINLVFATALRKVGDAGGAQEISQNVFGILARKAWRFAPDDSVPAWLYKTALLESKSWLRGEMRRRRREETAVELGTTMKTPEDEPAFNALVPLLDEALLSLREKDRAALLLRFYEKQSLREVGGRMGVSEGAAQKRVETALENISRFFQRRGFKTATTAAATAALQQTSASVPAVTTLAISGAVLKTAPTALTGLGAVLARLVSLSKVQTAAVCFLVAAGPVVWQWNQAHQANVALAETKVTAAATQNDLLALQTETDSLLAQSTNLDNALADAVRMAADHADLQRRFAAWKQRTRDRLLAADYHWTDDSPFVRIPKQIVPRLNVQYAVEQPGVLKQAARELLGLSPQERGQVEGSLQSYYAAMDNLMESSGYETNSPKFASVPSDALASQVFELPALGSAATQDGDQLQTALQNTLGDERWQLVKDELQNTGTDTLRRLLSLDAATQGQELTVWIQQQNGQYEAGYSWGQQGSTFSSDGLVLKNFLPGAQLSSGATPGDFLDFRQLPATLTGPALAWIQQQAETRLATGGGQ